MASTTNLGHHEADATSSVDASPYDIQVRVPTPRRRRPLQPGPGRNVLKLYQAGVPVVDRLINTICETVLQLGPRKAASRIRRRLAALPRTTDLITKDVKLLLCYATE